jgi:small subunit ribosomal protein S5
MTQIRRQVNFEDYDSKTFREIVIKINRCATVVKGGRRFSFSALVAIGNEQGVVGLGFGKANEVPPAVEKAVKNARKSLYALPVLNGTIPHEILGHFGASSIRLLPASSGTGIIAGGSVRAIVELAGIRDILSKCFGSTNPTNLTKATLDGLLRLRTREEVEYLRGIKL